VVPFGEGDFYSLNLGEEILKIRSEKRKIKADSNMIRISGTKVRVGAGGCTKVGLSHDEIQEAEKIFRRNNNALHIPDSAYLIKGRKPLLMLHVIQRDIVENSGSEDIPKFLFALGTGFPNTGDGIKTANYMVNLVDLKNWMDPDEEIDAL
jgi:hypothetical protein